MRRCLRNKERHSDGTDQDLSEVRERRLRIQKPEENRAGGSPGSSRRDEVSMQGVRTRVDGEGSAVRSSLVAGARVGACTAGTESMDRPFMARLRAVADAVQLDDVLSDLTKALH